LCAAGLLLIISWQKSRERDRFAKHWTVLSLAFFALSVDEVAGLHEALNTLIDIPWTIPAAALLAVLAIVYARFVLHLPAATRTGFFIAAALFVGGAVGVEHATDWYLIDGSMDSLGYNLLTALEEGLEMFGVVALIHTLLAYMSRNSTLLTQVVVE
jgi:hypothetical protein